MGRDFTKFAICEITVVSNSNLPICTRECFHFVLEICPECRLFHCDIATGFLPIIEASEYYSCRHATCVS